MGKNIKERNQLADFARVFMALLLWLSMLIFFMNILPSIK